MLFQYPYYGGGGQLQGVFQILQSWGFVDAMLPFLLIFALVYAILQKTAIFHKPIVTAGTPAKPDNRINGILAFVIASLVVVPHITHTYPPEMDPIVIMSNFLPGFAVLLLTILLVMMLLGFAGGSIPSATIWVVTTAALVILGIVIVRAAFPAFAPYWLQGLLGDPNTQALIIILLIFGLIVWFVTREEPPADQKPLSERAKKFFTDWFQ